MADRNELTDLLAAAQRRRRLRQRVGLSARPQCLRVSEVCSPDITNLGGARYQPTLRIIGKGDKLAEVPLNPRTHEAIDQALSGRTDGSLLLNQWAIA